MAQLTYGAQTPRGIAGSLVDLSSHNIDSRCNAETEWGALRFGMGVVQGDLPGKNVNVPTESATVSTFEGICMTGFTTEHDLTGKVAIRPDETVGVLRQGRAWGLVSEDSEPAYATPVYLIKSGDDAGKFTTVADENLAIGGLFIGEKNTQSIAPIELYGGIVPQSTEG
jgi:hypothetical protein